MTDYNSEMKSNMWKGQLDGNPDVEEEIAAGDKEGDEVRKQCSVGLSRSLASEYVHRHQCQALMSTLCLLPMPASIRTAIHWCRNRPVP